jgi:hypothetical protein
MESFLQKIIPGRWKNFRPIFGRKFLMVFFISIVLVFLLRAVYRERYILLEFDWQFKISFILPIVIVHTISMLSLSLAWHYWITRFTGYNRWRQNFYIYSVSLVARRIPGTIWYIGSRFTLYPKEDVSPKVIAAATGLELGEIGLAGILCFLILLPFYTFSIRFPVVYFELFGVGSLLVLVLRPGILVGIFNALLTKLHRQPIQVDLTRRDLFIPLGFYLASWFLDGICLYFVTALLIPAPPAPADVIGVSTLSTLVAFVAQFLPISFALKEITMSSLFSAWFPISVGIVIAIAMRITMTLVEIGLVLISRMLLNLKTDN